MKRAIAGAGLCVAIGAGTGGAVYGLGQLIEISPQQLNADAEQCASQLGSIAITAKTLPKGCKAEESYFSRTVTTTDTYTAKNEDRESTSKQTTYYLPTATEFRADNILSPAGIAGQEHRDLIMAGALGVLGVFFCAGAVVVSRHAGRPEPGAPEAAPAT